MKTDVSDLFAQVAYEVRRQVLIVRHEADENQMGICNMKQDAYDHASPPMTPTPTGKKEGLLPFAK
jgi:hypothetical protein